MTKRAAVIGAGIFGNSIAAELSKSMDVVLFEKEAEIMTKASGKNHFRHHYGYHYPRSQDTAKESIAGRESFEREYGICILPPFPNFYSVVREGSFVSPDEYLRFCDSVELPHPIVSPDPELINPSRVALTIQVPERGYDPIILKEICQKKLTSSGVDLRLGSEVVGGNISGSKELVIRNEQKEYEIGFDFIVEATYANTNTVKKRIGLPVSKRQYELLELLKVRIPHTPFGVINMDGPFTSIMPLGYDGAFTTATIAHTTESVLERRVTNHFDDDVCSFGELRTNKERIMQESTKDFPILRLAEFLESIYITKIVRAHVNKTDERPTEVVDHGNGVYSVFAGKIVTSVDTAKRIADMINQK